MCGKVLEAGIVPWSAAAAAAATAAKHDMRCDREWCRWTAAIQDFVQCKYVGKGGKGTSRVLGREEGGGEGSEADATAPSGSSMLIIRKIKHQFS